tara:strand:- start:41 stop:1696 length:1656 start_codon:yes stop_codon:yes gene_type:complete
MAEEINPRTGKPYSTNPRAVAARKKRAARKSAEAQARAEAKRGKAENPQTGDFETKTPGYTGEPTYTDDNYESPGQTLEQEGGYIDTGELDNEGRPSLMIGNMLNKAWQGAKTLDYEGNNPLDKISDVGAWAASNTIEALIPQNREELMFELMTLGQGKKIKVGRRLAHAALKDIPIYQKGTKYVSDLIDGIFNKSRFKLAYEGATESVYEASRHSDEFSNVSKIEGDVPTQKDITPNITSSNEKTLKRMGLWEAFREFDIDEFGGKVTRKEAKAIVTPEIPGFTQAQAERLGKLPELRSFYRNLTDEQIIPQLDHINPLKLSAYLMDKTTGAKRVAIRKVILDEGLYLAEMAENMQALPREVHKIWTDNMNKYLGKTHKNFQDTFLAEMRVLGITDPLDIAREYARRIKEARITFNDAYEAHKISYGTEWVENADELVKKLNDAFEAGSEWAPRRSTEAIEAIDASLANLDELPLNNLPPGNEGLEQVVEFLKAKLKELGVPKLSEMPQGQVLRTLENRTGMSLNDINTILQTYNIDSEEFIRKLFEVAE